MAEMKSVALSKELEQGLLTGRWGPGERLPSHTSLMKEYVVSRTCLREAVAMLEAKGFLKIRHGSGCYVSNLLEEMFVLPLQELPATDLSSQLAVMEMRQVLEGEAVYYTCLRATDKELQFIDQEYQRMEKRQGRLPILERAKADLTYHMLIARYSHNLIIISLSQLLYTRFFNSIYAALSGGMLDKAEDMQVIDEQHRHIHAQLMSRNSEVARSVALRHAQHTSEMLRASILSKA